MKRALSLFLCLAALSVRAGDWLQFRGPGGAGVSSETNLPVTLDAQKSVAWKIALPGRGLSSPLIVGDRVFVTSSSGGQQERLHIVCLKASDGAKLWERQFWATGRTTVHEKISVAAPTPASDGELIFALFSSNDLICLDRDGNLRWLRGLMRDYPNASNGLGLSSSPVVADGVMVVQVETDSEAFAIGIDTRTGINRWKMERPRRVNWTTPLLLPGPAGKPVVALQSAGGITAVEPATGKVVWSQAGGASTIPSSASRGDLLFIPANGITALQTTVDGQPPKELWRSSQLRPATASPLVLGQRIFILNEAGVLTCGDTANGNRLWQLRLKGPYTATPVATGGHLYVVNEKGVVTVVDPSVAEGASISELDLGEMILATPSIGGGAIYFRSDGRIWKVARNGGEAGTGIR
jgi:outer membrane protein assembly factor BamB